MIAAELLIFRDKGYCPLDDSCWTIDSLDKYFASHNVNPDKVYLGRPKWNFKMKKLQNFKTQDIAR